MFVLPAVSHTRDKGDYGSVGRYPFTLRLAAPGDLDEVCGLIREAAEWLQTSKNTDQWAKPWPDRAGQRERILNDLLKGKTWLVWDGTTAAATITVDTEEPLDANEQPVWPAHKRRELTTRLPGRNRICSAGHRCPLFRERGPAETRPRWR